MSEPTDRTSTARGSRFGLGKNKLRFSCAMGASRGSSTPRVFVRTGESLTAAARSGDILLVRKTFTGPRAGGWTTG